MNTAIGERVTFTLSDRQATGRQVLRALVKSAQATLDDFAQVALTYGLKATDIVEAYACRYSL